MAKMKVLVTGATGFLGNHVITALVRRGIETIAAGRSARKLADAHWYDSVTPVLLDLDSPPQSPFEYLHRPTHCIHLAWSGLPDYKSPHHMDDNLPKSRDFLLNMLEGGLKHILVTGTCFEYGLQEGELFETTSTNPDNAYGRAKDTLRRQLEEHTKDRDIRFQWARLFYMYGEGQGSKSLFAQLQRAIDDNESHFDMSGGEQIRDYLPVEKVAEALVDILCHPTHNGVVNVCSGKSLMLRDLVHQFIKSQNASIKLNLGIYPYPDWEPFHFWGSSETLLKIQREIL